MYQFLNDQVYLLLKKRLKRFWHGWVSTLKAQYLASLLFFISKGNKNTILKPKMSSSPVFLYRYLNTRNAFPWERDHRWTAHISAVRQVGALRLWIMSKHFWGEKNHKFWEPKEIWNNDNNNNNKKHEKMFLKSHSDHKTFSLSSLWNVLFIGLSQMPTPFHIIT